MYSLFIYSQDYTTLSYFIMRSANVLVFLLLINSYKYKLYSYKLHSYKLFSYKLYSYKLYRAIVDIDPDSSK